MPDLAESHALEAHRVSGAILKDLGPNEIADRIEHLDDFEARYLRGIETE